METEELKQSEAQRRAEAQKRTAALEAVKSIRDGMTLGLGTGSTVYYLLEAVGRMAAEGASLRAVVTSKGTETLAARYRIPVIPIEEADRIDLAIDGVDAVNGRFQSVKGGGGALFREKIIAQQADRVIWIMDERKLVTDLSRTPLPVEVLPFGWRYTAARITALGFVVRPRMKDGRLFVTDNGNHILDLMSRETVDYQEAASGLKLMTGVLETGFFDSFCEQIIIGRDQGAERRRNRI